MGSEFCRKVKGQGIGPKRGGEAPDLRLALCFVRHIAVPLRKWGPEVRRIVLGIVFGLSLLGLLIPADPASPKGLVDEIAEGLMCQCGCGKLLDVCEMQTAQQMKDLIARKLEEGWDKERIVEYLVIQYGEKVLAAPIKKGFNLMAWVTPFLALLAGGGLIWAIVVMWVRRRNEKAAAETDQAAVEELEEQYGARLEWELKEFE